MMLPDITEYYNNDSNEPLEYGHKLKRNIEYEHEYEEENQDETV